MSDMLVSALCVLAFVRQPFEPIGPVRTEIVAPIHSSSFNKEGRARNRRQGGNPRMLNGDLLFDGSGDGYRQVDPQIAVGGGYVLHGTNNGLIIYDKQGNYVDGVSQDEFNGRIDPKLFFDPNNRVYGFDVWKYWDKEKIKPVNISVSETSDPRGAWNTYPVSVSKGVDGGGIGFSRKWIGYSFPGGSEQTFVMRMEDAKAGKHARVYHFAGNLGLAVFTQDPMDDLLFVALNDQEIVITTVGEGKGGTPVIKKIVHAPHNFRYFGWPPASPQKGTAQRTASGDRNPKNIVLQSGHIWFCQTVNVNGRAGVQWHEVTQSGKFIQDGVISNPTNSYIQSTLAVNKKKDVLVGFQETGPDMFISGRYAWRKSSDPAGTLRPIVNLAEGLAATDGESWGDYSGSVFDADNGLDLWTIQSVTNAQGKGGTVIARHHF